MRNLIIQTYYRHESNRADDKMGCYIPVDDLAVESEKRFRIYADSIGADYMMLDEPQFKFNPSPAWARFKMFELCVNGGYDNVAYIDADILPGLRSLGNSLFSHAGHGKLTERDEGSRASWHINFGVVKFSQEEARKLQWRVADKKYNKLFQRTGGKNQDAGNQMFYDAFKKRPVPLDPRWNMTRPYHRGTDGGYFAHYIGHQKVGNGNQWGCMVRDPIYLEDWK